MPHFRQALLDGLAKYLTIKPVVAQSAKVEDTFGYVTTRVGGDFDGVCIAGYRLRIKDQTIMKNFIAVLDTFS